MPKYALFLTKQSFIENPLDGRHLGTYETWETRTEYFRMCVIGIKLAHSWLRCNLFWRTDFFFEKKKFSNVGFYARKTLNQFYSDSKVDIRHTEQKLRHSVEYWAPIVAQLSIEELTMQPPEIAKLILSYIHT